MKRTIWGLAAFGGMLILILDSQTALEGARQGMDLCWKTLIPALFPFFILSGLITAALSGSSILFLRPIGILCGIPPGTENILLTGLLGGYPVGAACVSDAWRSGILTREEAQRMLGFCSNAGPAFLFGMGSVLFSHPTAVWILWLIHILSALWVGSILPDPSRRQATQTSRKQLSFPTALRSAVQTLAIVCGWVIFFRVVIAFARRWFLWMFSGEIQAVLIGLLDLSNGFWAMSDISRESVRFVIASLILAAGGCCVTMQTASVAGDLSLGWYFRGKLLQCLASAVLCIIAVRGCWPWVLVLFLPYLGKIQKRSRNPGTFGI